MHLDKNLYVRADSIPDSFDKSNNIVLFVPLHFVEAGAEWIELERFVALFEHPLGGRVKLIRRAFACVPAVGVAFDLISDRSPQQLVYRLVEGLADDIPASNFEEGGNGLGNFAGASEVLSEHAGDEGFDVKGVFAENVAWRGFAEVAKNAVSAV